MAYWLTKNLSRRDFLRYSALASAGVLIDFRSHKTGLASHLQYLPKAAQLGRVFKDDTISFSEPTVDSKPVANHKHNSILELLEMVIQKAGNAANEVWYRLKDGSFINAHDFQPVENQLNAPKTEVRLTGELAEVTVPLTDAWNSSSNGKRQNEIFYFGSTHWVYGIGQDSEKNSYYLVKEDRWNHAYYVNATHMHVLEEEELLPITGLVPLDNKRICISLEQQVMMAYEKDEPIFMSPLASGQLTGNIDLTTPVGSFMVNYKRPSRHMAHSDRMGSNGSELFGVPWVTYFTDTGIAFHGTYWHNNFTRPRSHGCINLPIPAARWVYLWTQPIVPPREQKFVSRYGTKIEVI